MTIPPILILPMHESMGFLKQSLQVTTETARDLIEMTIYCRLETVKMNGIEFVYGTGRPYISVYDTLDDFLDQKLVLEPTIRTRGELYHAARNVLDALADHDRYWEDLIHHETACCRIQWRRSDVLIYFA